MTPRRLSDYELALVALTHLGSRAARYVDFIDPDITLVEDDADQSHRDEYLPPYDVKLTFLLVAADYTAIH